MERFTPHNVFEKGTCISQDKLMGYLGKKLSAKEQHEVERHLITCDFCSDALEGFGIVPLSENSLDIINQRVKSLTADETHKTIDWRAGLALAASVAGILIGIFWLLSLNNTSQNLVAENKEKEISEPVKEAAKMDSEPVKLMVLADTVGATGAIIEQKPLPEKIIQKNKEVVLSEKKDDEGFLDLAEAEDAEYTEEIETAISEPVMTEMQAIQEIQLSSAMSPKSQDFSIESKSAARAPQITEIDNYKVVDYSNEYTETDMAEPSVENQSLSGTSAKYESVERSEKSMEENEITRAIPYEEVLKKAIKSMDDGNYVVAIEEFTNILQKYPADENASFYPAYCYYQMKKYNKAISYFETVLKMESRTFYEEAKWYMALSFRDSNKKEKAQKIFKEIVGENGFYKEEAAKELAKFD